MRIIVIGDIHGRTNWKQVISNEVFDRVVFIGDYFDTKEDITAEQQKDNFRDIIAYKKANMDKVVLLFGNHDFHYLRNINEKYSGYQTWHKTDIQELLHHAIDNDLLQMCYIWQNIIFSHAGITKTWCDNNSIKKDDIEQSINDLFKFKPNSFKFTIGKNFSQYGDDVEQSPIWVRPGSLIKDRIDGFIQVVGHTVQDNIVITDDVILIDTMGTSKEYLIWDNNQFNIGKIDFK